MNKRVKIKRLERLSTDQRPVCAHAFTLFIDGLLVQDDPPCSCGEERVTLVAASEDEGAAHESAPPMHGGVAVAATIARAKGI